MHAVKSRRGLLISAAPVLGLCLLAAACVADETKTDEAQTGTPQPEQWEAAPVDLPPATRYAAYDAPSDTLWVLSGPSSFTEASPTLLTEFHPESGNWETHELDVSPIRLPVGGGILTDVTGAVWMAFDRSVKRYYPDTEALDEWKIPHPGNQYLSPIDSGLDRFAVALAVDGDGLFWVALHSITGLYAFDPEAVTWDFFDTSPYVALDNTKVTARGDVIYFNGYNPAGKSFELLTIDATTREVTSIAGGAIDYVFHTDGSVTYLEGHNDIEGTVTVRRTGQTEALAEFSGIPAPYAYMVADADGNAWLWRTGRLAVDIVRIDPLSAEQKTFAYPLVILETNGNGPLTHFPFQPDPRGSPQPVAADPSIQALVVDKRGDVWVVSASGDNPPYEYDSYPPLYRLHPE